MVRGARNSEEKRHSPRWYLRKVRYNGSLKSFDKLLKLDWYFSVFSRHSRDIGSISILMKALFLSMQIESSKPATLRFNGSAAERVSVNLHWSYPHLLSAECPGECRMPGGERQ